MRSLEWTHSAKKYFDKLPSNIKRQISKKIELLREDPYASSIELKDWGGVRRVRSGDWRILFRVLNDAIRVIAIGPRGDIYK